MPCAVYERVRAGFKQVGAHFREMLDATRFTSSTTDEKLKGTLRQLSLEVSLDSLSEYVRRSQSTLHAFKHCYLRYVVDQFGE